LGSDMVMKKIWILVLAVVMFTACGDDSLKQDKEEILSFIEGIDGTEDFYVSLEDFLKPQRSITPDNCIDDDREAVKAFVKSLDYSSWHSKRYDPAEHEGAQGGIEFGISITGQDSSLSVICVGDRECIVSLYTDGNVEPDAYAVFICGVKEYRALCDICGVQY